jgi:hypothetical protein
MAQAVNHSVDQLELLARANRRLTSQQALVTLQSFYAAILATRQTKRNGNMMKNMDAALRREAGLDG